ncbi:hypothetical protein H6G81_23880 [Scytonema hofmannii FACHB-248]|uniref:Uncharacterized protein n=1 Tax=Scytonema hofmannii FACHB-248 TaxID=1842502 RepID=A0ABR8GVF7_9CYAN|nr:MULTISPECIES: hypothetical protein [Nostocales]MBD2607481.1 hypothetical protein [Scytonema hofmannii FACHB-248]
MATINISDLHPAGSDLFSDSEGYMRDLVDSEFDGLYGGLPFLVWTVGYYAVRSSKWCVAGAAAGVAALGGIVGWNNA